MAKPRTYRVEDVHVGNLHVFGTMTPLDGGPDMIFNADKSDPKYRRLKVNSIVTAVPGKPTKQRRVTYGMVLTGVKRGGTHVSRRFRNI